MNSITAAVYVTAGLLMGSGVSNAQLNKPAKSMHHAMGVAMSQLPERQPTAPTGRQFVAQIQRLSDFEREQAVVNEILRGNFPNFLRQLKPVVFKHVDRQGRKLVLTSYVMPDYIAVGSDEDFVRFPINLLSANEINQALGFILPTRKMVNQIYKSAPLKLSPVPMRPGPRMTTTAYFTKHNAIIGSQLKNLGVQEPVFVAGHKKDVVQTNKLKKKPGAIAIYGWHRLENGRPIQPLSTVHVARYADYSHGIRMVSEWATLNINGESRTVNLKKVIESHQLNHLVSDEGPIFNGDHS